MELKAVVRFKGALAHYSLSPGDFGICEARLVKFEGTGSQAPPQQILLVRSVRQWVGSSGDGELLRQLGHAIDSELRKRDGSSPESGS